MAACGARAARASPRCRRCADRPCGPVRFAHRGSPTHAATGWSPSPLPVHGSPELRHAAAAVRTGPVGPSASLTKRPTHAATGWSPSPLLARVSPELRLAAAAAQANPAGSPASLSRRPTRAATGWSPSPLPVCGSPQLRHAAPAAQANPAGSPAPLAGPVLHGKRVVAVLPGRCAPWTAPGACLSARPCPG